MVADHSDHQELMPCHWVSGSSCFEELQRN